MRRATALALAAAPFLAVGAGLIAAKIAPLMQRAHAQESETSGHAARAPASDDARR
jgi:hypothetical protein